jgi:S-formylglutathione hydrolase FrmB
MYQRSNKATTLSSGILRAFVIAVALCLSFIGATAKATGKIEIQTIEFKSSMVGQRLPYCVFLPVDYSESNKRYPVLYLLHGLTGHYDDWATRTNLAEYLSHYEIMVVTPEGHDGWYSDSATVPGDKYESYIVRELIPEIDSHFRTIKDRRGRAIAGLSMGGYGALKFALKYPDQFSFAASMSGALDPAVRSDDHPGYIWDFLKPSIMSVFGEKGSPTRAANDLHQLARNLTPAQVTALPFMYIDCGTEDGFLDTNRDFASILLAKKVPHEFRELPGLHGWGYWDRQIRGVLHLFAERQGI